MAICPEGHQSTQVDYCDICGRPIGAETPELDSTQDATIGEAAQLSCPSCGTRNVPQALFCEVCGLDFTTGEPNPEQHAGPDLAANADSSSEQSAGALAAAPPDPQLNLHDPTNQTDVPTANPPLVEWVAELWIDPEWYEAQGSPDPMPSPGLPDIAPLVKSENLIGRVSPSRGIFPDVDCELDNGCSRRHAMLSTDGTRWWIEDLGSANGTFVASAAGRIPAMPIPQGKVELPPNHRIYLGAWTRIVVRRATSDEQEAFRS